MCLNKEDLDSPNFWVLHRKLLQLLSSADHKWVDWKDVAVPLSLKLNQSPAQSKRENSVFCFVG